MKNSSVVKVEVLDTVPSPNGSGNYNLARNSSIVKSGSGSIEVYTPYQEVSVTKLDEPEKKPKARLSPAPSSEAKKSSGSLTGLIIIAVIGALIFLGYYVFGSKDPVPVDRFTEKVEHFRRQGFVYHEITAVLEKPYVITRIETFKQYEIFAEDEVSVFYKFGNEESEDVTLEGGKHFHVNGVSGIHISSKTKKPVKVAYMTLD